MAGSMAGLLSDARPMCDAAQVRDAVARSKQRERIAIVIAIIVLLVIAFFAYRYFTSYESTDDAQVDGQAGLPVQAGVRAGTGVRPEVQQTVRRQRVGRTERFDVPLRYWAGR